MQKIAIKIPPGSEATNKNHQARREPLDPQIFILENIRKISKYLRKKITKDSRNHQ